MKTLIHPGKIMVEIVVWKILFHWWSYIKNHPFGNTSNQKECRNDQPAGKVKQAHFLNETPCHVYKSSRPWWLNLHRWSRSSQCLRDRFYRQILKFKSSRWFIALHNFVFHGVNRWLKWTPAVVTKGVSQRRYTNSNAVDQVNYKLVKHQHLTRTFKNEMMHFNTFLAFLFIHPYKNGRVRCFNCFEYRKRGIQPVQLKNIASESSLLTESGLDI